MVLNLLISCKKYLSCPHAYTTFASMPTFKLLQNYLFDPFTGHYPASDTILVSASLSITLISTSLTQLCSNEKLDLNWHKDPSFKSSE